MQLQKLAAPATHLGPLAADGTLIVNRAAAGHRADDKVVETDVRNITDAAGFLRALPF